MIYRGSLAVLYSVVGLVAAVAEVAKKLGGRESMFSMSQLSI